MNVQSIAVGARSTAIIKPGEPIADGDFNMGLKSKNQTSVSIDQLFTMVTTAIDDCSVNLITGIATVNGGQYSGAQGKDADGVTVALSEIAAVHLRNVGLTDIKMSIPTYDGSVDVISDFVIKSGGEFFFRSQASTSAASLEVYPAVLSETVSFELCVLGKL